MVGDCDFRFEPAGEHLAPTAARRPRLIDDSGVSENEHRDRVHFLNFEGGNGGVSIAKSDGQFIVPTAGEGFIGGFVPLVAVQVDHSSCRNPRRADIDSEDTGIELARVGLSVLDHQAPHFRFCLLYTSRCV